MTEQEKMLAGENYDPMDPHLLKLRTEARLLTDTYNATPADALEKRTTILKQLFGATGDHIVVETDFHCDYGSNIYVGENFYANFGCVILDVAEVRIGDNCLLAPQVGIYTATHPIDPVARVKGIEFAKPIRIGHNCWIGGHATLNPGVTLGDNVVVASGSVVTKSFGDNVVIAGNPARVLKQVN